jgi:hypothetical protein
VSKQPIHFPELVDELITFFLNMFFPPQLGIKSPCDVMLVNVYDLMSTYAHIPDGLFSALCWEASVVSEQTSCSRANTYSNNAASILKQKWQQLLSKLELNPCDCEGCEPGCTDCIKRGD